MHCLQHIEKIFRFGLAVFLVRRAREGDPRLEPSISNHPKASDGDFSQRRVQGYIGKGLQLSAFEKMQ